MLRRLAQNPARANRANAFGRPFVLLPRRLRILFLIVHRVVFGFVNHDGLSWSAAMAFWLVLSLPPLVIAVSSVASAVLGRETAQSLLADQIIANLPAEGDLIRQLVEREIGLVSIGGLGSLVLLLFSGSRVFTALIKGIYVMWRHVERESLIRREMLRFALVVIVGGLMVSSIILQLAVLAVQDDIGALSTILITWVLPFALVVAGLFITYRLLPRGRATWQTALLGAVTAAILLRIAQVVFVFLLGTVLEFEDSYGPVAEVALLATWAFVASATVLLGAELVATLDRHRIEHLPLPSSTEGEPGELGLHDASRDDRA